MAASGGIGEGRLTRAQVSSAIWVKLSASKLLICCEMKSTFSCSVIITPFYKKIGKWTEINAEITKYST
ncbi:hypothetical protein TREAZ_1919 [Leadbettera azotonutricia ZAS-9]|uniref:Uncharacterized protein n=1 Tax=Leadbettera azotonutricia (strain ATCC BAA-888 / DSM 13862 / ZAS-9) TaxID=545695 RepID=F5YB91_LEAAZ|nr:hypothetical protein TREAZ_1919 [Leadbettera azotonutricia ZAS-9]